LAGISLKEVLMIRYGLAVLSVTLLAAAPSYAQERLYDRLNGPNHTTGLGGYDPSNDWDYYQRHANQDFREGRSSYDGGFDRGPFDR
jgi:hypothetical protein